MRGHDPILTMRRNGSRPSHVTLAVHSGKAYDWWTTPELLAFPEVQIEPADVPELLDLRFLVGLPVVLDVGTESHRMDRLMAAVLAAGASRVYPVEGAPSWRS